MARATFLDALVFLRASGRDQVRLLGGEPTLHPDFAWHLEQALAGGFRVLVFSNGILDEAALDALAATPADRVSVLVNVQGPAERLPDETERQSACFGRLGARVTVGFNIHTPNPDLDALLDLIETRGLNGCVRLGLAHPGVGRHHAFLPPRRYAEVGAAIARFVSRARSRGIGVELDCGFVPCMFPQYADADLAGCGLKCGPIPDFLPDGSLIPCYPLAALWRGLPEPAWRTACRSALSVYDAIGVFPECAECDWRLDGACTGGCRAAAWLRLRSDPFRVAGGRAS